MVDKQIHANELKLRILMTNICNMNCGFCLNDFQQRDHDEFVDFETVVAAITHYQNIIRSSYPLQVYFSGGEPTMHRKLIDSMSYAKILGCRVTLNTNGTFPRIMESRLSELSDQIHFGTYRQDKLLAERAQRMNGTIQCVYSVQHPYVNKSFLDFYLLDYGLPVKVFQDFNEDPTSYNYFMMWVKQQYPYSNISFRHTGKQENRGNGCNGCTKKCITLKAIWLFPDNTLTCCPQLPPEKRFNAQPINVPLEPFFIYALKFHQVKQYNSNPYNRTLTDEEYDDWKESIRYGT